MSQDIVTAYDLPEGHHDETLTLVHWGSPMGELVRRYWHPVGPIVVGFAKRQPSYPGD